MNYDAVNPKLLDLAQSVTETLIQNLKKLCEIENEYSRWTKEEKEALGIKEYFQQYVNEYKQIIDEIGTEKLKNSRYGGSISHPAEYHYLFEEYRGICVMKSTKKVTVEFYYQYGNKSKHQFTLKLEQDEYKLDGVKYGFWDSSDEVWHKTNV
ncbi:MAG: hypothetical protein R3Y63_15460 [Eubacteriales bacterium]